MLKRELSNFWGVGQMSDSDRYNFARMLRKLKERSGRSYLALSTRTELSTSSLHRYCSGKSLPPSFDIVLRIAEGCGAAREEVVELRRRWLVATALRGSRPEKSPQFLVGPGLKFAVGVALSIIVADIGIRTTVPLLNRFRRRSGKRETSRPGA